MGHQHPPQADESALRTVNRRLQGRTDFDWKNSSSANGLSPCPQADESALRMINRRLHERTDFDWKNSSSMPP
jgi:hypothetical protein